MKLEANPRQLREPDTKPLGNGFSKYVQWGRYRPWNLGNQSGERIFYFGSLSKIAKTPRQK